MSTALSRQFQDFSVLDKIVHFLVFAHEMNLSQLKIMCMSIIVYEHYKRFKQEYNEEVIFSTFVQKHFPLRTRRD